MTNVFKNNLNNCHLKVFYFLDMDPEMLEKIHKIVNESQYPVLFKNILKNEKGENLWQLLDWDFNELSTKIGNVKLPFREGENNITLVKYLQI